MLRYFYIGSAVAFVVATVLIAVLWNLDSVDRAVTMAERQSVHLAEVMVRAVSERPASSQSDRFIDLMDMAKADPDRFDRLPKTRPFSRSRSSTRAAMPSIRRWRMRSGRPNRLQEALSAWRNPVLRAAIIPGKAGFTALATRWKISILSRPIFL